MAPDGILYTIMRSGTLVAVEQHDAQRCVHSCVFPPCSSQCKGQSHDTVHTSIEYQTLNFDGIHHKLYQDASHLVVK